MIMTTTDAGMLQRPTPVPPIVLPLEDQAYERWVRRNAGAMLAVARRYLRREEDAWDAVKGAFKRAEHDSLRTGSLMSPTELRAVVLDAAVALLRSKDEPLDESSDGQLPEFLEDGRGANEPKPQRHAALLDPELRKLMRLCFEQLPDRYRVVLVFHDFDRRTTLEIAALLGLSPSVVTMRLRHARRALRTLFDSITRA